jgi:hypothetical protein
MDDILCDYETDISKIKDIDLGAYDIILWDVEHIPITMLPRTSAFFIAKHSNPSEDIIGDNMQMGFDMFVISPLDYDTLKNALSIYYFIEKCKNNCD